jgi:molybdopterin molybdotransferase
MTELGPSPLAAGEDNFSVSQARAAIAGALRPLPSSESHPARLSQLVGRVLALDVISPINVPPHDNSAMDGYAFAGSALVPGAALELPSLATVFAGQPFAGTVAPGTCVRIMTGAVMPQGTDTVVPHELVQVDRSAQPERVRVPADVIQRGENRRQCGEDLALGGAALRAGRVLRPADVGLIASLGLTEALVMRRLRVALFSTGNEVLAPGQAAVPGSIYDSNRPALAAALQRLGMEVVDLGLVKDDPAALEAVLQQAIAQADVVLTSGGVSAGDADYTREVLARHGQVAFWKVAMRPGRPFAFGPLRRSGGANSAVPVTGAVPAAATGTANPSAATSGATDSSQPSWLFALPGNPVAALVTFYSLVREGLLTLAGASPQPLPVLQARCTVPIRKRPGRTEFQRAIVEPAADGSGWLVRPVGSQGAGVLRSMSEANALLVLGHEHGSVAAGEPVNVWLFDGLV